MSLGDVDPDVRLKNYPSSIDWERRALLPLVGMRHVLLKRVGLAAAEQELIIQDAKGEYGCSVFRNDYISNHHHHQRAKAIERGLLWTEHFRRSGRKR